MADIRGSTQADILVGTAQEDTISGFEQNDILYGLGGNDLLDGGAGDDTLVGGDGLDRLVGGAGNDTYYVSAGDGITETANNGFDRAFASGNFTLNQDADVQLLGYAAAPTTTDGILPAQSTTANVDIQLTGNNVAQRIEGAGGADVITAGRNSNALLSDSLAGFGGNDIYVVRNVADLIGDGGFTVDANGLVTGQTAGTSTNDIAYVSAGDLLAQGQAVATYTLNENSGIEVLSAQSQQGTELLSLTGSTSAETIIGNLGNNTLNGGGGVDTLIGLDGNDNYVVTSGTEVIVDTSGVDTITFATGAGALTSYNLGTSAANSANADVAIERIVLTDTTNNVVGNNAAQTLDASGLAAGIAATLNGGGGMDTLIGHAGNDTFIVNMDGETVTETSTASTADVLLYNGTSGGFNLTAGTRIETMAVANASGTRLASNGGTAGFYLVGSDISQSIFGAGGNDILDGDRGATTNSDTMYGGAGNDIYRVYAQSDVASEAQFDATGTLAGVAATRVDATGTDTIFTSADYSLAANATAAGVDAIENLTVANASATTGYVLTGSGIANQIVGASGNDTIDGGAGADTMIGLGGSDRYTVDNANDVIVEAVGGGSDRINFANNSNFAYVLSETAEVETINLGNGANNTSSGVVNVTGNAFAQAINGTDAAETINGGGGADTLSGGGGIDTYTVSDSLATIIDNQGANIINYNGATGGINVGNQVTVGTINATGAAATGSGVYLVGNNQVQTINGGAGADTLNGLGGADVLNGGAGDDVYRVYGGETLNENPNAGIDTVYTSVNYTLGDNLENLVAATQADQTTLVLQGNSLNNAVSGSNGNNVLAGAGGNDLLTGLGGADTFHFAAVGVANADIIADFNSAQGDKISLDAGVFVGGANGTTGFGPTLDGTEFQTGSIASGTGPTILYDQATGRLFFDSDGAGANAAQLFATVNPGTVLSANDFVITPAGTIPTP